MKSVGFDDNHPQNTNPLIQPKALSIRVNICQYETDYTTHQLQRHNIYSVFSTFRMDRAFMEITIAWNRWLWQVAFRHFLLLLSLLLFN